MPDRDARAESETTSEEPEQQANAPVRITPPIPATALNTAHVSQPKTIGQDKTYSNFFPGTGAP